MWGLDRRTGIPRSEVKIEADARGMTLDELTLDAFAEAETLILKQDAEARKVAEATRNMHVE